MLNLTDRFSREPADLRRRTKAEAKALRARAKHEAKGWQRRASSALDDLRETASSRAADLRERAQHPVAEEVRDRASQLGARATAAATELAVVRRRMEGLESSITRRLSDLFADQAEFISGEVDRLIDEHGDRFGEAVDATRRTTWPRRMFWVLVGAGLGVAAAYYLNDRDEMSRDVAATPMTPPAATGLPGAAEEETTGGAVDLDRDAAGSGTSIRT